MEPTEPGRALAVTRCSACLTPPPVCVLCLSVSSVSRSPLFYPCPARDLRLCSTNLPVCIRDMERGAPWSVPSPGTSSLVNAENNTGQTYHHIIPYAGHMRLTAVSAPTFSVRTRPSVILAEIDRINNRLRPSLAYQPAEDFLNSRSIVSFDDEARAIRGQAAHLLKRIHTPVPRALRPLPVVTTGYEYEELPLPPRITSDMYIQRLLGLRDVQHEVLSRSYYNDPGSRANIGKGHLACVSYAGGKAFSRRRPLASHENNGDYIRNNVKMLSHYERMREAAKSPVVEEKVFPGESRPRFIVRGPRPVNSGYYRPTNDPGKEYAEALASAAIATANFNMHTAALEENRKNKQKREDARLASAAEEQEKEGDSASVGNQEPQSEQVQKKLEEEVKRKAEEEAKRKAEEAKKKAEEEAKKKAEEEAKNKAEQEAKKKAEEEAKKKAEEESKKKAEEEAKRKAEEEAKRKAEEEAKRKAEEEEAKRKAEEEEAKRKAEEEAKKKAEEEEARKKAEEEEAKRKAEEEEAKRKEEEEARIKAEEEESRKKQEEEEAKKKAEEEAAQESEPAKGDDIEDIWAGVDEDMPRKKVVPEVPVDTAEEETQPTSDQTDSKPAEEEQVDQGPEPVVEEPTSPETPAPTDKPEIEEVPASEEE